MAPLWLIIKEWEFIIMKYNLLKCMKKTFEKHIKMQQMPLIATLKITESIADTYNENAERPNVDTE